MLQASPEGWVVSASHKANGSGPEALSDRMFSWFLPRNDDQIGMQELAAAVLCVTISEMCKQHNVTHFIDNNQALNNVISGFSQAGDVNALVGSFWLYIGRMQMAWHGLRVFVANPGDDPSRDDDELAAELGAQFLSPVWASWLTDFWQTPDGVSAAFSSW